MVMQPKPRGVTWLWIVLGAVADLLVVCGIGAAVALPRFGAHLFGSRPARPVAHPAGDTASAGASGPACAYQAAAEGTPLARRPAMPPPRAVAAGTVHVRLATSQGDVTIELNADDAPCTVNSFLSLARGGFYDGTPCHRLTSSGIYVLQCGDPTGTGTGGPGYRFGDENLPTEQHPAYPRGTVAMANAGPGTNGSQFFLVYQDSEIYPNYTVFGRITAGMDVLDKIAGGGTDDNNGPGDGRPKLDVTIRSAKLNP